MTERCEPAELRTMMVDRLSVDDDVTRWAMAVAPWRSALTTVPRHRFIPDIVWIKNSGSGPTLVPLHREDDPDRWLRLTYACGYDDAVITQIDDGYPEGPGLGGSMPTSSASSPVIVAVMLAALDAHPGHRVLEIGTGTGYNAALLADRLGAAQITSIEVDPVVAAHAHKALSDTGYGGVVDDENRAELSVTSLHPSWVSSGDLGARFAIGQRVPQCQWRYWPYDERQGVGTFWLLDFESRSWAKLTHSSPDASEDEFPVYQCGPRRLWDEVQAAHDWWVEHGTPDADRWRFTVTPTGQRIELA